MPNAITQLADRQRNEVDKADAENLRQLITAYGVMYERLGGDIDALILAIEKLDDPTQIKNTPQYRRLIRNAERELDRFTVFLETVISTAAATAIGLGLSHSSAFINGMGFQFTSLEPGVLRPLLGYLNPEGVLYSRLRDMTGDTVDAVVQSIIDGVSVQGFNPRKIASGIQDAFGRGLTDALRNTRTVQIWSYRDSARANYVASDVVQGWIWYANLDDRVCMSCVSQHGTIHELNETLDDHDNGRCAPLPFIEEFGNPVEQNGQDWFTSQPESTQAAMMGKAKYEAWKEGKFELNQLSHQRPDERYGTMRSEASLKSLLGEQK